MNLFGNRPDDIFSFVPMPERQPSPVHSWAQVAVGAIAAVVGANQADRWWVGAFLGMVAGGMLYVPGRDLYRRHKARQTQRAQEAEELTARARAAVLYVDLAKLVKTNFAKHRGLIFDVLRPFVQGTRTDLRTETSLRLSIFTAACSWIELVPDQVQPNDVFDFASKVDGLVADLWDSLRDVLSKGMSVDNRPDAQRVVQTVNEFMAAYSRLRERWAEVAGRHSVPVRTYTTREYLVLEDFRILPPPKPT